MTIYAVRHETQKSFLHHQAFIVEFLELFFPEVVSYLEPYTLVFLDKEVFTDVPAGEKYEGD